jgi:hypothetical protein
MDPTEMTLTTQAGATACLAAAERETDLEAKAAFLQLAEEFQGLAQEIEGLISTYDALINRSASADAANHAV